jgi:hypothetical protein
MFNHCATPILHLLLGKNELNLTLPNVVLPEVNAPMNKNFLLVHGLKELGGPGAIL